jgi:hypothetical protein
MPGYKYRGTNFDVPKDPLRRSRGKFDPTACGTPRGYKQHRRHYEDACQPCRKANAAHESQKRQ